MLKLFKKQKTTASNKTVNEVIAEIHYTFNSAGEKLLNEANNILSGIQNEEKVKRLERVGFTKSIEVKKWNDVKVTKDLADLIQYYQMNYPNNKFITEEQVRLINKKYGLVCAPIDRYKGFVPETKLAMIEKFKLKKEDENQVMIRITSAWNRGSGDRTIHAKNIHKRLGMELIPIDSLELYFLYSGELFSTKNQESYIEKYELFENNKLQICAPSKDMDLKELKKFGSIFQSFTTVTVPDPVVLMPCKGGYLIVTAWGDEASDEIVVNQKFN